MKGLRMTGESQLFEGEPAEYRYYFLPFQFYGNSESIELDDSPLALDLMTFRFGTRRYIAALSHRRLIGISSVLADYARTFDAMCDEADNSISAVCKNCCIMGIRTKKEDIRSLRFCLNDILPHITDLSHLSDKQCYEIADAVQEVARKFDQIIYPV